MLNVAGETHNESEGRRNEEKLFSQEITKEEGYWKEDEFKTTTILRKKRSNMAEMGDLPELIGLNIVNKVEYAAEGVKTGAKSWKESGDIQEKNKWYYYISLSMKTWHRAVASFTAAKDEEINKGIDFFVDSLVSLISLLQKAKEDDQAKELFAKRSAEVENEVKKIAQSIKTRILGVKVTGMTNDQLDAAVRKQRSIMMAVTAGYSLEKGTWKVGDAHVTDIKGGGGGGGVRQGNTNYLTRDEFNTELSEWSKKQSSREKLAEWVQDNFINVLMEDFPAILSLQKKYKELKQGDVRANQLEVEWGKWQANVEEIQKKVDGTKT